MTSTLYGRSDRGGSERKESSTTHSSSELRKKVIARGGDRSGFTLIELMVVLTVLTIVGMVTMVSVNRDRFEGSYRQFTDNLVGAVVQARHLAIDRQTRVEVIVTDESLQLVFIDPADLSRDSMLFRSRGEVNGGVLNQDVCIHGFMPSTRDATMPASCLDATQTLTFLPDGTFTVDAALAGSAEAGATLVVADRRGGAISYSLVQILPGDSFVASTRWKSDDEEKGAFPSARSG